MLLSDITWQRFTPLLLLCILSPLCSAYTTVQRGQLGSIAARSDGSEQGKAQPFAIDLAWFLNDQLQGVYVTTVGFGSPAQKLTLAVDPTSSDIWAMDRANLDWENTTCVEQLPVPTCNFGTC